MVFTIIFAVIVMHLISSSTVKGDLRITPSGPVKVLIYENFVFSAPLHLECICDKSECDNTSLTWELPTLDFAGLQPDYYDNFKKLEQIGTMKTSNDLLSRANITTIKNSRNGITSSILDVREPTKWDEDYYTCRSGNQSNRIYFLPIEINRPISNLTFLDSLLDDTNLNPLKMVYILSRHKQQSASAASLIIPCTWGHPNVTLPILQFKSVNTDGADDGHGRWESININHHHQQQGHHIVFRDWTSDNSTEDYHGFELRLLPSFHYQLNTNADEASSFGLYRCATLPNLKVIRFTKDIPDDVFGSTFVVSIEESINISSSETNTPVIRPAVKFLVFQTGLNLSLSCDIGTGWNITWKISSLSLIERSSSRLSTNGQVLTATLTIGAANYLDTGYYTCYRSDNESISTKQFVFIQDLDRLILPAFSHSSPDDVIFQSSAVIGCVPTTPSSVDVILYRKNERDDFIQVYSSLSGGMRNDEESSGSWEYNIFQGFKIKNVTWELAGDYHCMGLYHKPTVDSSGIYTKSGPINKTNSLFTIHVKGVELMTPSSLSNSEYSVIEGSKFQLSCRWKLYNSNNLSEVNWCFNSSNKSNDNVVTIIMNANHSPIPGIKIAKKTISNGFYVSKLSWTNITMDSKGSSFNCILDDVSSSSFYITDVTRNIPPRIIGTHPSTNNEIDVSLEDKKSLTCQVETIPAVTRYFWNDTNGVINNGSYTEILFSENDSTLSFTVDHNFTKEDFTCYFINSLTNKMDSRTFRVRLRAAGSSVHVIGISVGLILVTVLLLILTPLLCRTIYLNRKRKRTKRKMRKDAIKGYREKRKNPYDPRWEFPRNRLALGEKLGSGEFGVVFKAIAVGTVDDPVNVKTRTVAVKSAKSSLNPIALKSLTSELRILIHLGPHLNIVNLFGACTKKFTEGELLIIEEFCRYGNLRDYLVANRCHYVNQLDADGNLLTPTRNNEPNGFEDNFLDDYGNDRLHQENNSADNSSGAASKSIMSNRISKDGSYRDLDPLTRMVSIDNQSQEEDDKIITSDVAIGEIDGYLSPPMLNDDVLPGSEETSITINTRNLISWSLQISRGMSHLASKKVVHRDLAARNILLAEGNVVKIADFGLARQLSNYNSDGTPVYIKKEKEKLPIKWAAIESLVNRIFSPYSDVWSFGVLLWEIFSLGEIPYEDVKTLSDLISFLQEGRRLEKPALIPNLVGELMTCCWKKEPGDRPTFTRIEQDLCTMLEESVQHLYVTVDNDDPQTNSNETTNE